MSLLFKHRTGRYIWFAGIALLFALSACSSPEKLKSADPPDNASLVLVPQDQMSHIQVVTVQPSSMRRSLRLTGTVAFNGFDTTPVVTQISGPVTRIVVQPGQQVHRGQPLLFVASPDYSQTLANYVKTRDAYQLADKNYQRSKDLYDHHAIAERDLEADESARDQAAADLGAAEQSLRVLGVSKPESVIGKSAASEIAVLAPISGEAVERLVAPGQLVQAGNTQVFTISNTATMWVLANVYQKDLPHVKVGDRVTITTDAYPGTEFNGKISYIAAALDPNTRTLQARIEVKNPGDKLKKDMYVDASVVGDTLKDALLVPNASVMHDSENQPFVYVASKDNQFLRRQVTVGESSESQTQISSGLAPGDRIVGNGSLFLQFASSLQ